MHTCRRPDLHCEHREVKKRKMPVKEQDTYPLAHLNGLSIFPFKKWKLRLPITALWAGL
jgi:hypothetical protein